MSFEVFEIENEKCACKGSFLDKFLQPALLVILSKGPCHGFLMISELEKSGMVSGDSIDPTGMYRTLKKMEAAQMVTSYWDTQSSAKPKKIYSITDEGRHCLTVWKQTLSDYRENISSILRGIDKVI